MDEVLKLAKYLTLHIAAMDEKHSIRFGMVSVYGIDAAADVEKLRNICGTLELAIKNYVDGGKNVSKS